MLSCRYIDSYHLYTRVAYRVFKMRSCAKLYKVYEVYSLRACVRFLSLRLCFYGRTGFFI